MDNRSLTVQQEQVSLLAGAELDPRMKGVARAIQIMGGIDDKTGKYKLTEEMAIAAAMYQMGTGQLIGRDFYMNEKIGRMEGYRGVARDAAARGVGEIEIRYRPLTAEEMQAAEVQPGDTTIACEVYQLRAWKLVQASGRAYQPIVGIGLIREIERFTNTDNWRESSSGKKYKDGLLPRNQWRPIHLEGGMTWHEKAKNRAYKSALRHTPGMPASGEELLVDASAEIPGFQMPPEGARLDLEQAAAWAMKQQMAADIRENPEAYAAQGAALNERGTLQRKFDEYVMKDEPCEFCGIDGPISKHANNCKFRTLYPKAPLLEVEEGQFSVEPPAPLPPAQAQRPPANGDSKPRPKQAAIKTRLYAEQVGEFVKACPYYQDKNGNPDTGHILGTLVGENAKINIFEITDGNISQVWKALHEYATEQEQAPA